MKYLVTASSAVPAKFIQEEFASKRAAQKRMTEILKSGFEMVSLDKRSSVFGLFLVLKRFSINLK